MAKFEDSVGYVLAKEGLYSDHPKDRGGPTFWGISLRFLEAEGIDIDGDGDTDIDDIKSLTRTKAIVIFAEKFWEPLKLDLIESQAVATRILDMSVNMGKKRGVKVVQKSYNSLLSTGETKLKVDGKLGPKTRKAVNSIGDELMDVIREFHEMYYRDLVKKDPDQYADFLDGWVNRAQA